MFPVDIGNGKDTWCGTLQRLHVGEKHYFKGWSGLVANLQRLLTPNAQLQVLKAIVALIRTVHPCENRDVGGVNTATLSSIINTVSTLES